MFPSIPERGTKSRVETQVRITMDLAHSCSSSDPFKYDRVGSWKWLKLPQGTATKRRTRKQGKIGDSIFSNNLPGSYCSQDPEPQDILHLTVSVTCSTPPHNPVLSCSSCQAREVSNLSFILFCIHIHHLRLNAWQKSWPPEYDLLVRIQTQMETEPESQKAKHRRTQQASSSSIVPKSLTFLPVLL